MLNGSGTNLAENIVALLNFIKPVFDDSGQALLNPQKNKYPSLEYIISKGYSISYILTKIKTYKNISFLQKIKQLIIDLSDNQEVSVTASIVSRDSIVPDDTSPVPHREIQNSYYFSSHSQRALAGNKRTLEGLQEQPTEKVLCNVDLRSNNNNEKHDSPIDLPMGNFEEGDTPSIRMTIEIEESLETEEALFKKKIDLTSYELNILTASTDFLDTTALVETDFSQAKTNYNLINITSKSKEGDAYFIVPRESFIKRVLSAINQSHPVSKKNKLEVQGYDGLNPEDEPLDDAKEGHLDTSELGFSESHHEELAELKIFDAVDHPSMKCGHLKIDPYVSAIERTLMVTNERGDLIAAINFIINLKAKFMEIKSCAVSKKERRKGIGSLLLQSTLLIGMLYGVEETILDSTIEGLPLYLKHAFYEQAINKKGQTIRVTNSQEIEQQYKKDKELPILQSSMKESFECLRKLMNFSELETCSYKDFEHCSWTQFESILNKNHGRVTLKELEVMQQHLKIDGTLLNNLTTKAVTSIPLLGKREPEVSYFNSGLELFSVFSVKEKHCCDPDVEFREQFASLY